MLVHVQESVLGGSMRLAFALPPSERATPNHVQSPITPLGQPGIDGKSLDLLGMTTSPTMTSQADLSLAGPLTNSLTFLFSIAIGRLLGEPARSDRTYFGLSLIAAGVVLCIASKHWPE